MCGSPIRIGTTAGWGIGTQYPRMLVACCIPCYMRVATIGTQEGREAVKALMDAQLPPVSRGQSLSKFVAEGDRAVARDQVVRWAIDVVQGINRNLYIWGDPNRGKTFLSIGAFKAVGYRTATILGEGVRGKPSLICRYLNVTSFVAGARAEFARQAYAKKLGREHVVEFLSDPSDIRSARVLYNEMRLVIAKAPILFIDDIGKAGGELAMELIQVILEHREENKLPTCFTSNYSPDQLGARIGEPQAARVFRNECVTVEVKGPDFCKLARESKT